MPISLQAVGVEAASPRAAVRRGALARWHLLSLDAPTVSAVWTWFLARSAHVAISPLVPAAMFVAVWLLYAVDRLLDAAAGTELEDRHRFHSRHRRVFTVAIGCAAVALAPLVLAFPAGLIAAYLVLGAALLLWFGVIHRVARGREVALPKELLTGIFFGLAVAAPAWQAAGANRWQLLPAALCAAQACGLNCLFIHAWEHEETAQRQVHATTRFGLRLLRPLAAATVAIPLAAAPFAGALMLPVLLATALSGGLLLALDRSRGRMDATDLRALADVALLTPLLAVWLR